MEASKLILRTEPWLLADMLSIPLLESQGPLWLSGPWQRPFESVTTLELTHLDWALIKWTPAGWPTLLCQLP